jgi:hypothetical protein
MNQMSRHDCDAVRNRIDSYTRGGLRDDEASGVRDHLVACDACRSAFAAADPSVLFLRMRGTELPEGFWTGFSERVRERLDARRFSWGDLFRYPKLAYLTAPVAMVLLLSVSILVTRPGGLHFGGWSRPEVIPSPYEHPKPRGVRVSGDRIQARRDLRAVPSGREPSRPAPPLLEEAGPPGSRVYRFSVGEGSDETPIFLVVDESIDI